MTDRTPRPPHDGFPRQTVDDGPAPALGDVVRDLGALLRAAAPRANRTRVLAIDGRSGAGKSTLAAHLRRDLGAPVVSLEDLYGGWDGLWYGVGLLVSEVLAPIAAGRAALVPRYDWTGGSWLPPVELPPTDLLIVEGVGAGAQTAAAYAALLVWVEAPERTRRRRALARDGETYRPHWDRWAAQEAELFAEEAVRDHADVIVVTDDRDDSTAVKPTP